MFTLRVAYNYAYCSFNAVRSNGDEGIVPLGCNDNPQGTNARKVNCGCVYSAYILKPVLSGRNL